MEDAQWLQEDVQRLLELHKQEATVSEVAKEFGTRGRYVRQKCRELGITLREERAWSSSELSRLEHLAETCQTVEQIAFEMSRTKYSIAYQAKRHGIKLPRNNEFLTQHKNSHKRWTDEDDRILQAILYQTDSPAKAAEALGRSLESVRSRMSAICLGMRDVRQRKVESVVRGS